MTDQQRRLRRQHGAGAAHQRAGGQRGRARVRGVQLRREHVQRVERERDRQLAHEEHRQAGALVTCAQIISDLLTYWKFLNIKPK